MLWYRASAIVVLYLGVGVAFYTSFEDKQCEYLVPPTPPWWQRLGRAKLAPELYREPWTIVDALYFCTVSMSTVGFGDFSPSSDVILMHQYFDAQH